MAAVALPLFSASVSDDRVAPTSSRSVLFFRERPPPRLGDAHPRDLDGAPVSADAPPSYPTDTDSHAPHCPRCLLHQPIVAYRLPPLGGASASKYDMITGFTGLSETTLEPVPAPGFYRSFPRDRHRI